MSVSYFCLDAEHARRWTEPADRGLQLGRRMHRQAVWFHVAGDAHMLIGRIRNEIGRFRSTPPFNELIARSVFDGIGEISFDFQCLSNPDAKIIEPRSEHIGIDALFPR